MTGYELDWRRISESSQRDLLRDGRGWTRIYL